jgi:N-acetyl sugar amidotransferase
MKYCKSCLQPDTRPGEKFSVEGNCLACGNFALMGKIDFEDRFLTLLDILKRFPKKPGQLFDCILGVSGGKDSTRQALWVRDKLGLNPLLVSMCWPPEQLNERGARNISNLIEQGFDLVVSGPAPQTWRKLMRASFLRFGNWARSTELALYSSVPQAAIRHDIQLIFNGEDPGQKELQALGAFGWDNNNVRNLNTLSGAKLDWLLAEIGDASRLLPFMYPDPQQFERSGIQIVDLGWFLGDWSFKTNGAHAASSGLDPRSEPPEMTGDPSYVSSLDEDWVSVNQIVKYYKFGFGKATDYLNEEMRFGRLSREQAIPLAEKFDGNCDEKLIESFCEYIDITVDQFWSQVRQVANRALFDIGSGKSIRPRFKVGVGL